MINKIKTPALLLITFLSLFEANLFAQSQDSLNIIKTNQSDKKFYFQFGLGYNFNAGIGSLYNYTEDESYTTTESFTSTSYGKGGDISMGLGYMVAKNLGFEVEVGFTSGTNNTAENQYYDDGALVIIKQKIKYKANTFRINPKLLFEIPSKKGTVFYSKIGYLVGFGNSKVDISEDLFFNGGARGSGSYLWNQTGGLVSGSTTAVGFKFLVEQDLFFFMELTGNNLHRTFKKSSMVNAVENNSNALDYRPTYYKETIFVDQLTTYDEPIDQKKPRESLSFRSNYSTVGFRIGLVSYF